MTYEATTEDRAAEIASAEYRRLPSTAKGSWQQFYEHALARLLAGDRY